MKKLYMIQDTENVQDCFTGFEGMIFEELSRNEKSVTLNTLDGDLIFNFDDIKDLDESLQKVYEECESILKDTYKENYLHKKEQLYGFLHGINKFVSMINWTNLYTQYALLMKNKIK